MQEIRRKTRETLWLRESTYPPVFSPKKQHFVDSLIGTKLFLPPHFWEYLQTWWCNYTSEPSDQPAANPRKIKFVGDVDKISEGGTGWRQICPLQPLKVKIRNFCVSVGLFRCEMGTQDPQSRIPHFICRFPSTYNFVWKCILENIFGTPKSGQILHKKCFLQLLSTFEKFNLFRISNDELLKGGKWNCPPRC